MAIHDAGEAPDAPVEDLSDEAGDDVDADGDVEAGGLGIEDLPVPSPFVDDDDDAEAPPKAKTKTKEPEEEEDDDADDADADADDVAEEAAASRGDGSLTESEMDALADRTWTEKIDGEDVTMSLREWIRKGQLAGGAHKALDDRARIAKEFKEVQGEFEQHQAKVAEIFGRLGSSAQGFLDEVSSWNNNWSELLDKAVVLRAQQLHALRGKDPAQRALVQSQAEARRVRRELQRKEAAEAEQRKRQEEAERAAEQERQSELQQQQMEYRQTMEGLLGDAVGPVRRSQWDELWAKYADTVVADAKRTNTRPTAARLKELAKDLAKKEGLTSAPSTPKPPPPPPPIKPGAGRQPKSRRAKKERKTVKQFFNDDFFQGDLPLPDDPFLR